MSGQKKKVGEANTRGQKQCNEIEGLDQTGAEN